VARILFATWGSYGDLNPYIAVGRELTGRGHAVTIATVAVYAEKIAAEGLGFHAVRPDPSLEDKAWGEAMMDPRRGAETVMRYMAAAIRDSYDDTVPAARQADLIVTHPLTFGAVFAAQQFGKAWISSVLAPVSFLSAWDPPALPPTPWIRHARKLGPGVMSALWKLGKGIAAKWVEPVVALRRELGLPDNGNPLFEGANSPRCILALFSRYMTDPQPDWPPQAVVTGFPFHDRHHELAPSPELARFLDEGDPPVVFTLGTSAVLIAGDFYRASLQAVTRMGVRAVFLVGNEPQGLPEKLPPTVLAVPYAPHSEVFPRACAIVHQGGVGTTAQAMRSGRPMLVVPFAHDQFDNGERVKRKGAGEVLYRTRYNAVSVEKALRRLPACEAAAKKLGEQVRSEDGARTAADAIERVLRS
jgi:UDP:flavonoid glycosyltransferase YjiC (YdhE family)